MQKFVSHEEMLSSSFPVGITAGLPSILPGTLRTLLRSRDLPTTRACLAFLSIFRVLRVPSILKLQTITDPFSGVSTSLPALEIGRTFSSLRHRSFKIARPLEFVRLNTAGPNGAPSVLHIPLDVLAWKDSPLRPTLERFITLLEGPSSAFLAILQREWESLGTLPSDPYLLGRLAIKEEAAGKARVFAITDAITQSVMLPLHQFLFSLLKKMPTDGTFDQGAPLDRLLSLKSKGELGGHKFHSFDLSAATDRLPIQLQQDILGYYVGLELASCWSRLMTDRD